MTGDPFDKIKSGEPRSPTEVSGKIGADLDATAFIPAMHRDKMPPLRSGWGSLGSPIAVWEYLDGAGQVLRAVLRFTKEDGSKDIRPATLWRAPNGRIAWKLKAEPEGVKRPLYRLDQLAARPGAKVLIVEGEKAASAAGVLFPDFVVMTWPGGANAVAKADWSVLAACTVVIWPDADQPGLKAANSVRRALSEMGAASAVVFVPESLPKGWDLADNWPEGFGVADASRILIEAFKRAESGAADETAASGSASGGVSDAVCVPPGFCCDGYAWRFAPAAAEGEDAPKFIPICGRFDVLAETRPAASDDWGLLIQLADPDGRDHQLMIPRSMMAGDGVEVRKLLASRGLWLSPNKTARERLMALLSGLRTAARARSVSSIGWDENAFVLPTRTIGKTGGELYIWKGRGGTYHGE